MAGTRRSLRVIFMDGQRVDDVKEAPVVVHKRSGLHA